MSNPPRPSNPVSALRARDSRRRDPRARRLVLGALLLAGVVGIAIAVFVHDPQVRGWAATVAVVSLLSAVIAWLAGISRTLSDSERDPRDFTVPP